jgi:tRNA dimethylallyltransferase
MKSLPIVAIVGPTATGKTGLSLLLAESLKPQGVTLEILSADSRVIYQELNIGTAKPTPAERALVKHWMVDVAKPDEAYSAARYQAEAEPILTNLMQDESTLPMVVGGTGFYIKSLLQEEFIPPVPPDHAFRETILRWASTQPPDALYEKLRAQDPERAAALHPNDTFRLVRALEIIHTTGQKVPNHPTLKNLPIHWVGLMYEDRDLLRQRIGHRIQHMIKDGWLEETESLLKRYGEDVEALRVTHGYPELVAVIQGKQSLEAALAQIQINIQQYATRQMTWFRRNPEIQWYSLDHQPLEDCAHQILQKLMAKGFF